MDISERLNRALTWCLTCLLRALPNTKETWQKIADRLMEKIAELARPTPGS